MPHRIMDSNQYLEKMNTITNFIWIRELEFIKIIAIKPQILEIYLVGDDLLKILLKYSQKSSKSQQGNTLRN